jgi:hypothetical protein
MGNETSKRNTRAKKLYPIYRMIRNDVYAGIMIKFPHTHLVLGTTAKLNRNGSDGQWPDIIFNMTIYEKVKSNQQQKIRTGLKTAQPTIKNVETEWRRIGIIYFDNDQVVVHSTYTSDSPTANGTQFTYEYADPNLFTKLVDLTNNLSKIGHSLYPDREFIAMYEFPEVEPVRADI